MLCKTGVLLNIRFSAIFSKCSFILVCSTIWDTRIHTVLYSLEVTPQNGYSFNKIWPNECSLNMSGPTGIWFHRMGIHWIWFHQMGIYSTWPNGRAGVKYIFVFANTNTVQRLPKRTSYSPKRYFSPVGQVTVTWHSSDGRADNNCTNELY